MRIPYNVKQAFLEPLNLMFIGLATLSLIATRLEDLPLFLGAVALESGYIIFVSDSQWYKNVLRERLARENRRKRAQLKRTLLPGLSPRNRARFTRLEGMRNQLPTAAAASFGKESLGEVCSQMDVLLDKFLTFAHKDATYRAYLVDMVRPPAPAPGATAATWADRIFDAASRLLSEKVEGMTLPAGSAAPKRSADVAELITQIRQGLEARAEALKAQVDAAGSDANRAVLAKNLEVVQKRQERIGELGDIITNLEYQLDLIESTFELISDQVRTLAPEQVLRDINDVVVQTESTTEMLAASAPLEFQLQRMDRQAV
jgi:outer membrane murein-binding lipoprotein Lpp